MGGLTDPYRILSLDGGGSLGVYTLGVLSEMEKALRVPLHNVFDLIYGTSTGSIIDSMIAIGDEVDEISQRYFEIIPDVMGRKFPKRKTERLNFHGQQIFADKTFKAFVTNIGIVTTDLELNRPMVFKSDVSQAHGMASSFSAGFGCQILDAVIASSAAYPIFKKKELQTTAGQKVLVDGGFSANNPALLALTDATGPLKLERSKLRLVSIGTGSYPTKKSIFDNISVTATISRLLGTNAATVDGLRKLLFSDVATVRINNSYTAENLRTNFVETDTALLHRIYERGRISFGESESDLMELLESE